MSESGGGGFLWSREIRYFMQDNFSMFGTF
jgi:hypothetical protein